MATIEVQDTGVGIDKGQVSSLFNVFTKIMDNRDLNKQGVGLGLAIAKNLAVALGGSLTVSSQKGIGTTFSLTITTKDRGTKTSSLR